MKILIVDDEEGARDTLKTLLTDIFERKDKYLKLFEADCLENAVVKIKTNKPELVLLDIEMPRKSGLEILDYFKDEPVTFKLIFITAYNDYALEAFRLNAVDYLLKPTDINELETAIAKVEKEPLNALKLKIDELRQTFLELSSAKIALEVPNGLMFVSPNDIVVFVADGMYTTAYLKDGTKTLITKLLKHFTEQLSSYDFFYKPHRSYLVNLKYLKEFSKKDGLKIILENGMSIPLSRDKKDEFLRIIKEVFD